MSITEHVAKFFAFGIWAFGAGAGLAQDYPARPIRLVTAPPGGTADFAARYVAQGLTASFSHPAVVDNRGGGVIPGEFVSKSPPDGYTLLVHGSPLWLAQFLRSKVPYDMQRDFAPITFVARSPNLLVAHPSLPVKSVKELIVLGKAKPGALTFSSGSTGSSSHLAAELFKSMAGVQIVRVPYKSDAVEIVDLMSGQIDFTFGTAAFVAPHVKAGKLKALAITSAQPSPLFPGLPTVSASGLSGYEAGTLQGVFAPAGTPAAVVSVLNQEIVRALRTPDAKDKFFSLGVDIVGGSPQESAMLVKSEIAKWGKVIRDAGIKAE